MSLTITEITALSHNHGPGLAQRAFSVAFDSSYASGGEPFDISAYLPNYAYAGWVISDASGYVIELVLGTSNSSASCKLIAYYCDNNGAGDSALIQVPGTTDLSALTAIRVMVQGC